MELSKLQKEFKNYLKNLGGSNKASNKKYDFKDKNVSIFSHAEEFDNFLNKNYKDDIKSATLSKSDLLSLSFKDGQFVEDEKSGNKKISLVGILNDLLTDKKMKCIIDSDNNGKINQAEIKEFLDAIENFDGKKGDISLEDLLSGTKAIQELDITKQMTAKSNNTPVRRAAGSSNGGYSAPVNRGNNGGGYNAPVAMQPKQQQGETIEQLEQKKATKEAEVQNAQEAYNKVFSGENEKVKAANEAYNTSKTAYEDMLKKEQNIKEEDKKKLEEAAKTVENAVKAVDEGEKALKDAENAVKNQEGVVAQGESNLSALKDSLGALQGQHSENPEKQAEIDAKRNGLESKIKEAEAKLNADRAKLDELKGKKEEAQKTLEEKKTQQKEAEEAKTKLEEEIIVNNENVSQELKDALGTYREAEKNVQTVKDSEAVTAQSAIDKAQGELEVINNQINEKKAEETKKENSVSVAQSIPEGTFQGVLAGKEAAVEQLCEKYGITDTKFIAAVIGAETGWGSSGVAGQNNPMSYRASGDMGKNGSGFGIFSTPEAGLEAGIRNIARYKDDYEGISAIDINNVDAIGRIYCEGGEWAGLVRDCYNSL